MPETLPKWLLCENRGKLWAGVDRWESSWNAAERRFLAHQAPRKALYDAESGRMICFDDSRTWK